MPTFRAALSLFVLVASAAAQTADDFFDDSVLHELRLYVHPTDWQHLLDHFTENTYYPAELVWRGITVSDIAIRSRGSGSRNAVKPGLKVDINRYVSGQQFLGLSSFILDNAWQDPTFLRERLSMLLFRKLGVPAPRETYVRLYVNDRYRGLYTIVESIDKRFLRHHFGEDDGYLYEYGWAGPYRFEYLGPEPEHYFPDRFKAVTHEKDPNPEPIIEMIRTISLASDEEFVQRVSEFIDLPWFVRYLAIENYVAEVDGILGYEGMNNFYLYRFERGKRVQLIPWDKDVAFASPEHEVLYNVDTNVLARRALAVPALREAYLAALEEIAEAAGATGGWLEQEIDRAFTEMRAAALEDNFKRAGNEDFEFAIEWMRAFARTRPDSVRRQIEALRNPPPVE